MPETIPNLIAGEWVESSNTITNINPSDTTDVIGQYASASVEDVDNAVTNAHDAQKTWAGLTPQQRSEALDRVATELLERREEIARQLSREEGKTIPESTAEVTKSSHLFKYYAGEAVRVSGEHLSSIRQNIDVDIARKPVGVVGLITPWNFPISIPAWKSAPALAYGNAVILKPSELTCASAWTLTEIVEKHLPKGVFQLTMGDGSTGGALSSHPGVKAVSFTGSTQTGSKIAEAVHKRGARLQMEMGGKNPLIIMEDADLELSVKYAISGAFYSTGQRCTSCSRMVVEEQVYEAFVDKMLKGMEELRIGHALESDSNIGPLISENQLNRVLGYIDIGRQEGATLAVGGEVLDRPTPGFYISPALFVDTDPSFRINQEEIFGPVASIIKVKGIEQAISVANDVPYGLCAGIMTNSLAYTQKFRDEISSGMAMVNMPTVGTDYHVPFGGAKGSGYGPREMGTYTREFYTVTRTVYTAK